MATTSLSLGPHWEAFIREQVAAGRYGSASEVVRESLRLLETRETRLAALRAALKEGEDSPLLQEPLDFAEIKALGRKAASYKSDK